MLSLRRLAALGLLLGITGGCTTLGGPEPPSLVLSNLELVEATVFETSLRATVRVVNPNPEPLALDGMALRISVNGLPVGKAVSPVKATVPRLSSATVPLELYVSNVALLTRLKPLMENRTLAWSLRGKVFLITRWGRRRLGVSSRGVLDLRGDEGPGPEVARPPKGGTK